MIAAAGHVACRLAFLAGPVSAEASNIAIAAGSPNENIGLVVSNTDAFGSIETD